MAIEGTGARAMAPDATIADEHAMIEAADELMASAIKWRPSSGDFTGLTPDMIILMVRRQLNTMDDQIKGSINEIETHRAEAENIGEQILAFQELERWINDHGDMVDGGEIDLTQIDDDGGTELRSRLGISDDAGEDAATAAFRDALNAAPYSLGIEPGATRIEMSVIKQNIDELKETQRTMNSGTEMTMMRLQSAMQQRTQILQLGSNMLSAQDQANDTIIGNLR
ncbi:MAG: hypothetical protein JRH11_03035 [Deltaproteobacteria bacterium]|nr:hypothetical protein [Deltaproteobacteria bacterium]